MTIDEVVNQIVLDYDVNIKRPRKKVHIKYLLIYILTMDLKVSNQEISRIAFIDKSYIRVVKSEMLNKLRTDPTFYDVYCKLKNEVYNYMQKK